MRILHLETVDSTNTFALRHFDEVADQVLVSAREQSAGRGRLGRSWIAPPGRNLTVSFAMSRAAEGFHAGAIAGLAALDWLLGLFYSICPNWQFFWLVDAVAVNKPIPMSYVWMSALYTALYIVFASMWAVAIFSGKEAAGDSRN